MGITESAAYLKGLFDGYELDKTSKEGKIIAGLIDLVSDMADKINALEADNKDHAHEITIEKVEDEHFISIPHPMTKQHFISFVAFVTSDCIQMVKFYPEGNAETRLQLRGRGYLFYYCKHHGLFKQKI